MPILLDNPESLKKVFDGFVKGDYTGIAKELVMLTKDNPEIKKYLNDNKEIFTDILDKTLKDVPGINKLDKKELYSILTPMLNQPDKLIQILENIENKKYINVATSIGSLVLKEGQALNIIKQILNVVKAGVGYFNQKSDKKPELENKVPADVLKEAQSIVSNLNSKINIVGPKTNTLSITPIANNKKKEEIRR
ncbi:hypothetical protein MCI_00370 [Rickettsia montanensis str. OSU 85-930]|uniref:Uncharacterized protein n=2 Tax=Rickettsia montanensis TaxID=33991 RepID=H8KAA5_RICMS|nr:hypothetical protein MCI_00370 [Rickettsia montanensis str. OSU 85-930]